jgi:anaerobic magnesium-protoporphyrin IX monomethyl ester cyclase
MPDVLLGQAYYLRFDRKLWEAQQPYAPLGALYAASCLRDQGHSVALFDAMLAESEREWEVALDRARPRVAVIYEDSFNYLSKMCLLRMREAALTMIDAARARGCPVVVSGSDATDHPDIYLARGAVAVVLGEGELTLVDLVDRLTHGRPLADVAGIAFGDGANAVVRTQARPFIKALDDLPFPAWDLVDVARYRSIWRRRHGYYAMNIATTRGCPYSCNWCAKPIYGQRYTVRSPQAVVSEIAWLARTYQPDQLSIVDDVFGLQPGWVESFAELMAQEKLHIPFRCLMRADQISGRVVAALASVGCRMVWMGAESGSQRILDAMDKGVRVEQIHGAARLLQDRGIAVGLFLQFGYLSETWEDIEATMAMARAIDPEDIGVSVSYPLPGTKFYERVRAKLGPKQNWFDSSDLAMMYRASYEPEFYRVLHRVVHHEFRVRRLARHWSGPRDLAAWAYNRAALPLARRRLRGLARPAFAGAMPDARFGGASPAFAAAITDARFGGAAPEKAIQPAEGEGTA